MQNLRFAGISLASEVQDQLHDQLLDLVAHRAILLGRAAYGVAYFPVSGIRELADRHTAEIDHQVEMPRWKGAEGLWKMRGEVDVLLRHAVARFDRDAHGGGESGALRRHDVFTVGAGESFGHLAAAGV